MDRGKLRKGLEVWHRCLPWGIGFVVAFVVALVVIRTMLAVVTSRGLAPFGWLRIVIGAGGLALLYFV